MENNKRIDEILNRLQNVDQTEVGEQIFSSMQKMKAKKIGLNALTLFEKYAEQPEKAKACDDALRVMTGFKLNQLQTFAYAEMEGQDHMLFSKALGDAIFQHCVLDDFNTVEDIGDSFRFAMKIMLTSDEALSVFDETIKDVAGISVEEILDKAERAASMQKPKAVSLEEKISQKETRVSQQVRRDSSKELSAQSII